MDEFGAWLSLVERLVRDQEAGGSNPLAPTNSVNQLEANQDRALARHLRSSFEPVPEKAHPANYVAAE